MKKLLSLALVAAMATVASASMAFPQGQRCAVSIDGCPSGFVEAHFRRNLAGYCGYTLEWSNVTDTASARCDILERKTIANPSCVTNRLSLIPTTVKAADKACWAFDQFQLLVQAAYLYTAETPLGLEGTFLADCADAIPADIQVAC
jgi:hypothetical protein